ncbi:hypothetical protein BDF20DRAFT_314776 [Mycotypha africana]|uniref:uncharacterized protein n=1 Tax=Mycotypha africana TaxID=64632 RepID=UPI00230078C9|nr:uncharacterized protein BDF20DRAFT_314776 [Mycotypha africana]KAI8988251.1 hypothetical protein BDF20DRAFT_314776 [Mycotypha africana]
MELIIAFKEHLQETNFELTISGEQSILMQSNQCFDFLPINNHHTPTSSRPPQQQPLPPLSPQQQQPLLPSPPPQEQSLPPSPTRQNRTLRLNRTLASPYASPTPPKKQKKNKTTYRQQDITTFVRKLNELKETTPQLTYRPPSPITLTIKPNESTINNMTMREILDAYDTFAKNELRMHFSRYYMAYQFYKKTETYEYSDAELYRQQFPNNKKMQDKCSKINTEGKKVDIIATYIGGIDKLYNEAILDRRFSLYNFTLANLRKVLKQ